MSLDPADLYHSGIVVDDLDAAKAQLHEQLGIEWGPAGEAEMPVVLDGRPRTVTFGYAYSASGAHRLELVQSIPGTIWTANAGVAHHLGYWSDDVPAKSAELTANGLPLVALVGTDRSDGPAPIVMHRLPLGGFVELVDRSMQPAIFGPA